MGRIPTIDKLGRRGFTLVNWCCLCKKNKEIINHFLIHCEYTSDLWLLVLNTFGVSWAMPNNVQEWLHYWKIHGQGHSQEAIWKVIFVLLIWSIWRERNWRLFEGCKSNVLRLVSSFVRS
jgi:hypothetical protein